MKIARFFLCLLLVAPAPAWSAWVADGNDHIDANNDVTGIDIASFSWSCWLNMSTAPVGSAELQIITHAAAISGGNLRRNIAVGAFGGVTRLVFYEGFSGQAFSKWVVNAGQADLSISTWYQIGVDYDGNAANDPVFVVNGVVRTSAELTAPSGTRLTGADSLRIGEDLGGTTDLTGSLAECGFWDRRLSAGEWSNLGVDKWAPSKIPSGLIYYIPLISDASETGGIGTLTVTGGTFGTHPPGIVYSSTRRAVSPMILP